MGKQSAGTPRVRLNEYDKDEWRDVAKRAVPALTDEEFEAQWAEFTAIKSARRALFGRLVAQGHAKSPRATPMTPPTSNPSAMSQELSEEKLRGILDGCEGVTPGPWNGSWAVDRLSNERDPFWRFKATGPEIGAAREGTEYYKKCSDTLFRDSAHIARLDPQTVAAIVTQLLSLQRKNEELVRALTAILGCEYDGKGLTDCIDNDGGHYQSAHLERCIREAEQALRSISEEK